MQPAAGGGQVPLRLTLAGPGGSSSGGRAAAFQAEGGTLPCSEPLFLNALALLRHARFAARRYTHRCTSDTWRRGGVGERSRRGGESVGVFAPPIACRPLGDRPVGDHAVLPGRCCRAPPWRGPTPAWTSVARTRPILGGELFGGDGNQYIFAVTGYRDGFVAVGEDCCGKVDTVTGVVWPSPDGASWTRVEPIDVFAEAEVDQVGASGGRLVAGGAAHDEVERRLRRHRHRSLVAGGGLDPPSNAGASSM